MDVLGAGEILARGLWVLTRVAFGGILFMLTFYVLFALIRAMLESERVR